MNQINHVLTILAVDDLQSMLRFYAQAFDWTPTVETPVYAEFTVSDQRRIGLYRRASFAATSGQPASGIPDCALRGTELYFHCEDVDAAFRRASSAGARELSPPTARPWGDRVGYLSDPEGTVIALAAPIR